MPLVSKELVAMRCHWLKGSAIFVEERTQQVFRGTPAEPVRTRLVPLVVTLSKVPAGGGLVKDKMREFALVRT